LRQVKERRMEQHPALIPLERIQPNPDQPRKVRGNPSPTLKESIRRFGVLQPIVVRPLEDGRYMIVSGERRYRAALALGMKEIPAVVREMDDSTAFEAAIAENGVRQNLDPLENVEIVINRLRQRGLDEEGILEVIRRARSQIQKNRLGPEVRLLMEITSSLGVSPSTVAVAYRHLFRLPEWLRKSLKGYHIPLEDLNRVAENPALIEKLKAQKEEYEKNPPRLPGRLARLGPEDHLRIYLERLLQAERGKKRGRGRPKKGEETGFVRRLERLHRAYRALIDEDEVPEKAALYFERFLQALAERAGPEAAEVIQRIRETNGEAIAVTPE